MLYQITIKGLKPIIHHDGSAGLDARSAANIEKSAITKKRGTNRTEADDARLRELEVATSVYWDENLRPTLPASALRACIETGARKLKQGPQVREGLIVEEVLSFDYDEERGGSTYEEILKKAQFTVGVVVQRARVLRTRAMFHDWSCTFTVYCDDELVDTEHLTRWVEIAGRRIGLGDWRPEKSGVHGRFVLESITPISE